MKKAKWLWLVPTALVLIAAFLLPRLLLHFEKKQAEDKVEAYNDFNSVLNYDALSIVQKLSLLADGNYSALIMERSESLLTDEEVVDAFCRELEKLYSCGAINDAFYHAMIEQFSDGMDITPFLVVDRIGNIAFQYYEIYSYEGMAYACYDPTEGKILHFASQGYAELLTKTILGIADENGSGLATITQGWADYFGLAAEQIAVYDNIEERVWLGKELNIYLSWCYLYDENGNRFAFALNYNIELGIIQFGGIAASEAEKLADSGGLNAEEVPVESSK